MSLGGYLISLFPYVHLLSTLAFVVQAIHTASSTWLIAGIVWLYLMPVLVFRIHTTFWPLKNGLENFDKPEYSPWWGSYQIQSVFIAWPGLESILMTLGLYSVWLRLWGSQIGSRVFWTPTVRVADRSLLNIGSRVIFGHRVELVSHVISQGKQSKGIYIKPIEIQDDVFVGAGSFLAPGSKITKGLVLPVASAIRVNQNVQNIDDVQVLA